VGYRGIVRSDNHSITNIYSGCTVCRRKVCGLIDLVSGSAAGFSSAMMAAV
jgi:hypothetical protein